MRTYGQRGRWGAIVFSVVLATAARVPAGLLEDLGVDSAASRRSEQFSCQPKPPPPRPAQHSSAEGIPPLPLPAVPLRRTEKKNPPRPPVLIAKIATRNRHDWATNPTDVDTLLRWMARELNVHFSTMNLPADQVPADPREVPLLYRTGHEAFSFSPEVRGRMRQYLLGGGTLVLDACCGRAAFARSAMVEMQQLIPERPPYRLSTDHPVYHAYADIDRIKYRPMAIEAGAKDGEPSVIGIDVGCRTAVFLFRWDVSCGWDNLPDTEHHRCLGYDVETAKKLGANLMAYITAERNAAIPLSRALAYVDATPGAAGKFVIAQAKYTGLWRTRDAGLSMLLNTFHEKTQAPVRFRREEVALDSPRLFDVPFVYLTGHNDFTFTPAERRNLQTYLQRGGILFAEACCGRAAFDRAFRREIQQVVGAELTRLPPNHLIYQFPNAIKSVAPRPALSRQLGVKGRVPPELLGITLNGSLAVIYSPLGLSCGWELAQCPYCLGVDANDSLAIGVNVLSYILTQ